jgi:excisionase family DNA binding protein|tara:strand:- start:381 stop:617 length:237 start_codon:yes stop_codon:yes gene_type:complete
MTTKRYINIKEASEYTSLPIKTLYDWANQGKIPSIKFGSRVLFDLHDIDKVMAYSKRPYLQHEKTVNKVVLDFHNGDI